MIVERRRHGIVHGDGGGEQVLQLLDMLHDIVHNRRVAFPSPHNLQEHPAFEDVYSDPYHNYFCMIDKKHVMMRKEAAKGTHNIIVVASYCPSTITTASGGVA